jgi:cell division protein FtsL
MDNSLLLIVLTVLLLVSLFMIYLMYVRIRQLEKEVMDLKDHRTVTDEELERLAKDLEEFKQIKL